MIYLDMDGVLANFMQHTQDLGIPNNHQWFDPKESWTAETWAGEAIKMNAMHSEGFWITMPMCPDALALWNAVPEIDRAVLTAKPQPDSPPLVAWEKFAWINKNLGVLPLSRFVCCTRDEKMQYALGSVLIDDDHRTCTSWMFNGGRAVHYDWASASDMNEASYTTIRWPNIDMVIGELKVAVNG